MNFIDGKSTAVQIRKEIAQEVKKLVDVGRRPPHLAAILVALLSNTLKAAMPSDTPKAVNGS